MHKIIFVSRLDADCSLGAYILCEIAERLVQKYSDLQIVIIGGGSEYEKISKKVDKLNRSIGHQILIAVGNVDNPTIYYDSDSLFIGVSRAALEAMAHGVPTILLGNEGYIGLLDYPNLNFAKKTNFTCRNFPTSDKGAELSCMVFSEICRFFELPEEEKRRLSNLSYQTVKNEYDERKMAEETVKFYTEIQQKYIHSIRKNNVQNKTFLEKDYSKIAICGYYGRGNLGDEAILSAIRNSIKKHSPSTVKIRIIKSKNPLKIIRALLFADIFIFGGGSLLQNATSNASLLYYLAIIRASNAFCKRRIMLSNGLGPIKSGFFTRKFLLREIAKTVDCFSYISVRDSESKKILNSLLPHRIIHFVPDPALISAQKITAIPKENVESTQTIKNNNTRQFLYIPCAKGLKADTKIAIQSLADTISKIANRYNLTPSIAVLNRKEDRVIALQIQNLVRDLKIQYPQSPKELCEAINASKFVISQRYHGALFACACDVPTLAISTDPKMSAFCKDFALFPAQKPEIFNSTDTLCRKIDLCIEHHSKNRYKIDSLLYSNARLSENTIKNILQNFKIK